jgi:hypothetical protein
MNKQTKKVWLSQKDVNFFIKQCKSLSNEADATIKKVEDGHDPLKKKFNAVKRALDIETYGVYGLGKCLKEIVESKNKLGDKKC